MESHYAWRRRAPLVSSAAIVAWLGLTVSLKGAPFATDAKHRALVVDEPEVVAREAVRTQAKRIKLGKIPSSLPIMPVVTADPYDDVPSRLRAAGLLKGPMPLRGLEASGIAAVGCTFDIDCEDGDPCTDDFCDIGPGQAPNTGVCNNEVVANDDQGDLNGDDCSDGLACNGTETCQGATVYPCEGLCVGGDNNGTCVSGTCVGGQHHLQECPNGDIDCKTVCIRETDCPGGGSCSSQVCVGGPNEGIACIDNVQCGSIVGYCQAPGAGNDPVVCDPGDVCDENLEPAAGCVAKCGDDGDCDDGLACNGVEVCDVGTGLCSSPGNPCGGESADCLEQACLSGGPSITGTFCETFNDCLPSDPDSCGFDGPYCFRGRCCLNGTRQTPNRTFEECQALGGDWYPGDTGQLGALDDIPCPVYSSGIGDAGAYLVVAGPASLSPYPYDLTDEPLRKIGDDYDSGQSLFIQLQYMRFAGGVSTAANGRIAFEFYDENGNFVEDVFFAAVDSANQIQVVHVFELASALVIPAKGFIVGHVLQSFASSPSHRGEFFWLSTTDPSDAGLNDPTTLYVDTDLDGTPTAVSNFLAVCNGGARDGLECDPDGDNLPGCPDGACESVPGILAFELEGELTDVAPRGGCCDAVALDCNEVLSWTCNGSYLGDNVPCAQCSDTSPNVGAACRTCSVAGTPCTGVADCPGGETCDLNDQRCRFCEIDFLTPCASDADCVPPGGGPCSPGTCEFNSVCNTGACCISDTGECLESHTQSSCTALAGVFQGLGTDCDPDCCEQPPGSYGGADHCEDAVVSLMEIPVGAVCLHGDHIGLPCDSPGDCGGAACERTVIKTITGDNSTASSTIADPDSCFPPEDAPGGELGWFEAIQIYDPAIRPDDTIACGYLVVDHCCTDPVKIPAYGALYDACPCDRPVFPRYNPNHPDRIGVRGAPFCLEDNFWTQFGPLVGAGDANELADGVGTYYYPVLSWAGGDFGQYQFHARLEACPDAVCCVGEDCRIVNILECEALGGFFLAPPNKVDAVTVCGTQCSTGSCCTGPGECADNQDPSDSSQIDVTRTWCENTVFGAYVGGSGCFGGVCQGGTRQGQSCQIDGECPFGVCQGDELELAQPSPCPICDFQGLGNCQAFNDTDVPPRLSDMALPGGATHVADDFKPLGDTITKLCFWGSYAESAGPPAFEPVDCADTAADDFRIRVYASDEFGMPDTNQIIGEANPSPARVVRAYIPNSFFELHLVNVRAWGYRVDLGPEAITGLDASGNTCYWLEIVNRLDGACGWSWYTVDPPDSDSDPVSDFSAIGSAGSYGLASPRNRDMAFCLDIDFEPGGCGTPVAYCCDCGGVCSTETRRDCMEEGRRWRVEDTCHTHACGEGAPDNDKCANVVLPGFPETLEGTVLFDNTCSNADGINPINTEVWLDKNLAADVWFKYIATCQGTVTFSTCATGPASGGGLDTVLAAYKDPVDPTQCVCPTTADAQDAAVAWYSEPATSGTVHCADENCNRIRDGGGGFITGPASPGDCFMIRVGGYAGQGNEEGLGTVTIKCDPPSATQPLSPVDAGNRYLRVTAPPSGGVAGQEAIRVRVVSLDGFPTPSPDFLYVGVPFVAPEEDQTAPDATFTAAPLSCDPYFRDWSTLGIISIYGAEIVPGSTYELQRANNACADLSDEDCWSTAVQMKTAKYGDVWPVWNWENISAQPDFNDIAAMVHKFQAASDAPSKAVAQLQPNVVFPDRPVDFKDIAADVSAFVGDRYPFVGPCACPSIVACGTTACVGDIDCGGGFCIDGFCTDACARCTP